MPHGPHLSLMERPIISVLHANGFTPTEISGEVNRTRGSVYNVINNPDVDGPATGSEDQVKSHELTAGTCYVLQDVA